MGLITKERNFLANEINNNKSKNSYVYNSRIPVCQFKACGSYSSH